MASFWNRIATAHVQFVTTGYLRIMEPIAGVLIKLGVSANALTTFGTASTVAGGVAPIADNNVNIIAGTPGCTLEGSDFRDLEPKFRKAGAIIVAILGLIVVLGLVLYLYGRFGGAGGCSIQRSCHC